MSHRILLPTLLLAVLLLTVLLLTVLALTWLTLPGGGEAFAAHQYDWGWS